MKKTLLLSVVASTMIMAGGDIAPVEPVVEAPAVVEETTTSGWDFSGQGVVYYQTMDQTTDAGMVNLPVTGEADLFSQESSAANVGLQLRAINKDVIGGLGMGFELSGLGTLDLQQDVVSGVMQTGDGSLNSAAFTQAYLTYGIGNTSLKVGRQQLPKALSPFAFSEEWNVFQNTFDTALLVNSDIPDTTLVGAYVTDSNKHTNLGDFTNITTAGGAANADENVYMITAQNKSIEGLTLTGTYYYAPEMIGTDDVSIAWGDAQFAISDYSIGLQGGTILTDTAGVDDTTAFGGKVGAKISMFDASVAYSSVDTGTAPIENLGTNDRTPLYTQMIANEGIIKSDSGYIKAGAGFSAYDGRFGIDYGMVLDSDNRFIDATTGENPYEIDVTYQTKVGQNTTLLAGYVLADPDKDNVDANNIVRVWGRYNF